MRRQVLTMTKRKRYTFYSDGHGQVGKSWRSLKEVCKAIAEWLEVCAINDFYPDIHIVVLKQPDKEPSP